MTKVLIQHGPAKGNKITDAINNDEASGVVFSLREELFDSIKAYSSSTSSLNKDNIFIDPQFYYSTFNKDLLKNLEHNFDFPAEVSRRDMRTKDPRIDGYFNKYYSSIKEISNNIITPTLYIDSIDWKFDYSLDIYKKFRDFDTDNKFSHYMSLLMDVKLFHSKNDVDEILLDLVEENKDYNNNGIYLVINYDTNADNNYESIDPETLSNILYFIYSLQKKNFSVIVGYTFVNSLLFNMLNCDYIASGWFNNLRKFNTARFDGVDIFGRRKKKYLSLPLLTYLPFETINEIAKNFDVDVLKSNTKIDTTAFNDSDDVSFVDLEHQYWEALSIMSAEANDIESIEERIKFTKRKIEFAIKMYSDIYNTIPNYAELQNVLKKASSHLEDWLLGIELFIKKAQLIIS